MTSISRPTATETFASSRRIIRQVASQRAAAVRVFPRHDLTIGHRDGQDSVGLTPPDPERRGGFSPGQFGELEYDHINHIFGKTGLRDRGQRAVLPTGSGTLRWSPRSPRPVASWGFDVEIGWPAGLMPGRPAGSGHGLLSLGGAELDQPTNVTSS